MAFAKGLYLNPKVGNEKAMINSRQSHTIRVFARLLVVLLLIGVVSPGWIWCHEDDGSVTIEFGRNCLGIPVPGPKAEQESSSHLISQCCVSCVDSPAFVVGAREDNSNWTSTVIHESTSVGSTLEDQYQGSLSPSQNYFEQDNHLAYLLLCTISSTVLLI